jgi:hypothetical protein
MEHNGLLSDYYTRKQLAEELQCHPVTIGHMEQLPDGLPSIMIAGRKFYHKESVRLWLTSRERRPNPRRRA